MINYEKQLIKKRKTFLLLLYSVLFKAGHTSRKIPELKYDLLNTELLGDSAHALGLPKNCPHFSLINSTFCNLNSDRCQSPQYIQSVLFLTIIGRSLSLFSTY